MNKDIDRLVEMVGDESRTRESFAALHDAALERVRKQNALDPRWTSAHWVTPKMLVEAIVVGHLRAWSEPPKASWSDPIICEWANYVATCFKEDLNKNKQTLLTLIPAVTAWLRDFPKYTKVASRFFDMDAAEQNVATYLIDRIKESES